MRREARKPGYQRMTDDIEAKIAAGFWGPGCRLPSLRMLAERFGINTDMARRGLWMLRDKGLLECRARSGVFVAGSMIPERGKSWNGPRIAIVHDSSHEKNYGFYVVRGILDAAARHGVGVEFFAIPYYIPREKNMAREMLTTLNDRCDAVIVVGSYDQVYSELPLRVPVVGVEMDRRYGGLVSPISLDPFEAAELAADFFRERGIREVQVVNFDAPVTRRRAEAFAAVWSECRVVEKTDFSRNDIGYLFTGGTHLHGCALHYRKGCGRELPVEELVILSMDGKALLVPDYGPVTPAILPDWRNGGELALEEALRRIRRPGCGGARIYLHVHLESPGNTQYSTDRNQAHHEEVTPFLHAD